MALEDRRIQRTKRRLKETLTGLLDQKPFEQLSVTEICAAAGASRVTFYTHYADKYELADELFRDMKRETEAAFARRQAEAHAGDGPAADACNLLESVLDLYYAHKDFFAHTGQDESPYLHFAFEQYVLRGVEEYMLRSGSGEHRKYAADRIAGFLCGGMGGFLEQALAEGCPQEELRAELRALMRDLTESGILG